MSSLANDPHLTPKQPGAPQPEPWLRGTLLNLDPLRRQVLHALELTYEDLHRWIAPLSDVQINAHPFGLPSVAFHLQHIARSLDRLLTYAEGRPLSPEQHQALATETDPATTTADLLSQTGIGLSVAVIRIYSIDPLTHTEPRTVGRAHLPTTVAGLLIHCAEHTQRHTGQAITTAKIISAQANLPVS